MCLQRDVSVLEADVSAAAESPEVATLSASVSEQLEYHDRLESRLNNIKDRLFADLRWACWQLLCAVPDVLAS